MEMLLYFLFGFMCGAVFFLACEHLDGTECDLIDYDYEGDDDEI